MELRDIKGIGVIIGKKLADTGIKTPFDLINVLPRKYLDMTRPADYGELTRGDYYVIKVKITSMQGAGNEKYGYRVTCEGELNGGKISLIWFNMAYVKRLLAVGESYLVWGKVSNEGKYFTFINPAFEKSENAKKLVGIAPVYAIRRLVSNSSYKRFCIDALNGLKREELSVIPEDIERESGLLPIYETYSSIHAPISRSQAEKAVDRLKTEALTAGLIKLKLTGGYADKRTKYYTRADEKVFWRAAGVQATLSQSAATEKIALKLTGGYVMNSTVYGDVGSGKTLIAFFACYMAHCNSYQSCIVAPTVILANQHYENARAVLGALGVKCVLVTQGNPLSENDREKIKNGEISLIIGTHALANKIEFHDLSLIVIDELQRFGVNFRARLSMKSKCADILTMSATPLPRSLSMALTGIVDAIELDGRSDRSNVVTYIVGDNKKNDMMRYAAEKTRSGCGVYVVCPRIFDAEGDETDNVQSAELLVKSLMPDAKVATLTGKMRERDKMSALQNFSDGKISVLVCTQVVEVGVNAHRANCMIVLGAEHFSLTTLHQLRGRIGRGGEKAECFLCVNKSSERIKAFTGFKSGAEIAEYDYLKRGAGDALGVKQSGFGLGLISEVTVEEIKRAALIADRIIATIGRDEAQKKIKITECTSLT